MTEALIGAIAVLGAAVLAVVAYALGRRRPAAPAVDQVDWNRRALEEQQNDAKRADAAKADAAAQAEQEAHEDAIDEWERKELARPVGDRLDDPGVPPARRRGGG